MLPYKTGSHLRDVVCSAPRWDCHWHRWGSHQLEWCLQHIPHCLWYCKIKTNNVFQINHDTLYKWPFYLMARVSVTSSYRRYSDNISKLLIASLKSNLNSRLTHGILYPHVPLSPSSLKKWILKCKHLHSVQFLYH